MVKKRILCILLCVVVALTGCSSASKDKTEKTTEEPTNKRGLTAKESYNPEAVVERLVSLYEQGSVFEGEISYSAGGDGRSLYFYGNSELFYCEVLPGNSEISHHYFDRMTGEHYYSSGKSERVPNEYGGGYHYEFSDSINLCTVENATAEDTFFSKLSFGTNEGVHFSDDELLNTRVPSSSIYSTLNIPFIEVVDISNDELILGAVTWFDYEWEDEARHEFRVEIHGYVEMSAEFTDETFAEYIGDSVPQWLTDLANK